MDLERYRERARQFLSESRFEGYQHKAGLKTDLDLSPIYEKFEDLFAESAIKELFLLHREAAPKEETRLRFLLNFAIDHALDAAVRDEDAQIARTRATADLRIGGEEVSFHSAAVMLMQEPDRSLRREAMEQRRAVIAEIEPVRIRRLQKFHARAQELTGRSYSELYEFLFKVNFELLSRQLQNFLGASESYYKSRLERFSQEHLGFGASEMEPWDSTYLVYGSAYDSLFPEGRMLSILKRTLLGMELDLKKLKNLTMDSADRPSKSPYAHCTAVDVPDRVFVSFRPLRGLTDCLALFNEVGQALHYCYTSDEEVFEYKYLGDKAMGETYAFLFQYFTLNDDWCWDFLKIPADSDFLEFNQLRKLYLLRRHAARFLFELKLHSGAPLESDTFREQYRTSLEGALSMAIDPALALHEVEDSFYGTHHLRAWIFEAELRQIFNNRFGKRWYSRPAAGDFLKSLWSHGHRYTVEELAQQIRLSELDLSPITRELK